MLRRVRMSPVDTAWLRMDRGSGRAAIKAVIVLDGDLDAARFKQLLKERLVDRFPRFCQRVVEDDRAAWWEADPRFSLLRHLRFKRVKVDTSADEIRRLAGEIAIRPLKPNRPLWQLDVIRSGASCSALVVRVHHCIADGLALMGVLLSLTEGSPDGCLSKRPKVRPRPDRSVPDPFKADLGGPRTADALWSNDPWTALLDPLTRTAVDSLEMARAVKQRYLRIVSDPVTAARFNAQTVRLLAESLKLLMLPHDSMTRLKGRPAADRRMAWAEPLKLSEARALGRHLSCSVNDILMSCIAGALRRYLQACGDSVDGVDIRAMVPVNLRRGLWFKRTGDDMRDDGLGNRLGLIAPLLPLHEENPLRRLQIVKHRMDELKNSMMPPLSLGLMAFLGLAPMGMQHAVMDVFGSRATAVVTNVPGPSSARWISGAKIDKMHFWVPQSGALGLGFSLLSYDGGIHFGLIADAEVMPDPQTVAQFFIDEFQRLVYAALLGCS